MKRLLGCLVPLALSALLVPLAVSAPLLLRPPAPTKAIRPGSYIMTWRGTDALTHFHADGFFACHWQGSWWNGRWTQKGGVLSVEEWQIENGEARCSWMVRLASPTSGDMNGTAWELRARKPKRID